uniref:Uncharacterized protein n=1 Tax=Streptomyces sp. FR1 TaxID=349971 RepID=I1VH42_9ACTN|nr:hypothetical protein [Streptomyces sp. FR1]AFI44040.1 hypothetical protein pFP4.41 [Streptomyces sp. FR1]
MSKYDLKVMLLERLRLLLVLTAALAVGGAILHAGRPGDFTFGFAIVTGYGVGTIVDDLSSAAMVGVRARLRQSAESPKPTDGMSRRELACRRLQLVGDRIAGPRGRRVANHVSGALGLGRIEIPADRH